MNRRRAIDGLLPIAFVLAFASAVHAGAWTQPEGALNMAVTFARYESSWYWDEQRESKKALDGAFSKTEARLYLEYGLTDRYTAILNFPWKRQEKGSPSDLSDSGVGDIEIGLRRRLWNRGSEAAAVQLVFGIPAGYDDRIPVALGSGNRYADLRYVWGRSWPLRGGYGYVNLEFGYRAFDDDEPNQFRMDGILYAPLSPSWGMQLALNVEESEHIARPDPADPAAPRRGHRLWKAGIGPVLHLAGGWSLSLIVYRDVLGAYTGEGTNVELSIWTTFPPRR